MRLWESIAVGFLCLGTLAFQGSGGAKKAPDVRLPKPGGQSYSLPGTGGQVDITWEFRDTGRVGLASQMGMVCSNICQGQKHLLHEQCNLSCDDPCDRLHHSILDAHVTGTDMGYAPGSFSVPLERDTERFGCRVDGRAMDHALRERFEKMLEADKRLTFDVRSPCWNKKPCTHSMRFFEWGEWEAVVKWDIYRFDTAPDGRQVKVQGPKGSAVFHISAPLDGTYKLVDTVYCSCTIISGQEVPSTGRTATGGGTQTNPPRTATTGGSTGGSTTGSTQTNPPRTGTTGGATGATPPGTGPGKPATGTGGAGIRETGMGSGMGNEMRIGFIGANYQQGEPIDRKFLQQVAFNVSCPSLSTCLVTASNSTTKPIKFTVCAGTMFIFIPGEGEGAQDTILVQDLKFNLPAFGTETKLLRFVRREPRFGNAGPESRPTLQIGRLKPTDPNAPTKMPVEGRVLCLDIDKRAPTVQDTFGVGLPPSLELARIAKKTMVQPMQGPWDQARVWIATDAATFDKVNDRLRPPIAKAQYIRCMQECSEWAGIDFTQGQFRLCLEPKLVTGIEAGAKALQWFGRNMGRVDGPGLASSLKAQLAEIASKFSSTNALDHADRIAGLASGMIESGNPECADAAFDLLLKGVPEEGRPQFRNHRGIEALTSFLLRSEDPALVAKALDVVEALKPKWTAIGCMNLSAKLPQELRSRGKALAGTLK